LNTTGLNNALSWFLLPELLLVQATQNKMQWAVAGNENRNFGQVTGYAYTVQWFISGFDVCPTNSASTNLTFHGADCGKERGCMPQNRPSWS